MLCHAYHSWILWVNVYSAMTKAASWHKSSVPTAFCWSRRSRKVRTKPGALSLSRLSRVTALWSRDLWGEIPKSSSKFCQAGSLLLQAANLFLLVQGSATPMLWNVVKSMRQHPWEIGHFLFADFKEHLDTPTYKAFTWWINMRSTYPKTYTMNGGVS